MRGKKRNDKMPGFSHTVAPRFKHDGRLARASTRRTTLHPGPTSAFRTRFAGQVFQDPGISVVAEQHDMAVPDPQDLDGGRGDHRPVVVTVALARISAITTSGSWVWYSSATS